ncbi:hypothetical protein E6Q11_05015 [Candidatus Dojkabacteria bacterium]|uniref:Uncharacterized protein n=1 Tax=Candidatus Dojkabacteria bacterium TaxID=2099670 RepID=A0A5C7J426_9BACT|nr:MAG: hypothetical protein E6Q11_05015 [Candidatus Dojkabacteria bacterium]
MKNLFTSIGLVSLIFIVSTTNVNATSTTKLQQQIVPIDCVFEVINTGPYQVVWITPEECGQEVTPTTPDPGPNPSTNTGQPGPSSSVPDILKSLSSNTGSRTTYFQANQQPSPTVAPDTPTNPSLGVIKLNIYPEYRQEGSYEGKKLQLQLGQSVYFDSQGRSYTIVLTEITEYSVQLAITRMPEKADETGVIIQRITLAAGEGNDYDINGDGQPDIRISLPESGVVNGVATLMFKELGVTQPTNTEDTTKPWWPWQLFTLLAIVISWVLINIRRKNKS